MLYVMNQKGHYFSVDTAKVELCKEKLPTCRFFDDEKQLLLAVCSESQCELEEVEGSTFQITKRNGSTVMFDDRGFAHDVEGSIEKFVGSFVL